MSESSPIPKLNLQGLKDKKPKDYLLRFAFGAAISTAAALIGMRFPVFGGMFLAFPAILPASLTLVERDSGTAEAAIDAEGAIFGALGLMAFALVAAFGITPLGAVPALIAAAIAWVVVAIGSYSAVMAWRAATKKEPGRAAPG
jgi:CDP-diglyceride synthetase